MLAASSSVSWMGSPGRPRRAGWAPGYGVAGATGAGSPKAVSTAGDSSAGWRVAPVVVATSRQSWRRRTWSTWPRLAAWVWRAARSVASVVISMVISCGGCF